MGKGYKMLSKDCDPTLSQDSSLPTSAYLVEYLQDGVTKFDLVMAGRRVDIFDDYWDNYRSDLKNITQAEGRTNPKLYNPPKKK